MLEEKCVSWLCLRNFKFNPALPPFKFLLLYFIHIVFNIFPILIRPLYPPTFVSCFSLNLWSETTRLSNIGHQSITFISFTDFLYSASSLFMLLSSSTLCFWVTLVFSFFAVATTTTASLCISIYPTLSFVLGQAVFEYRSSRHNILMRVWGL